VRRIATALVALAALAAVLPATSSAGLSPHAYTTRITGATPAVLNGPWRLAIRQTTFSVGRGSAIVVSGTVQVAGSRVTFRDRGGPLACRGAQTVGVYAWRLAGKKLTLRPLHDTCGGRRTILSHPWTLIV
jgi:hypothetical protein